MCTLALYFHVFPQYPIIVAANRDESLTRPSLPPTQLWSSPRIYGGQDLRAGGTWLGVNEHGVLVGVLNRHTGQPADPHRRSRGHLCLDALKHRSALEALHFVCTQSATEYNPFNLLIADCTAAYVVHSMDTSLRSHRLSPGVHLLTNLNLNDPECPRIARSFQLFLQLSHSPSSQLSDIFTHLCHILATHDIPLDPRSQDPRNGLCVHLPGYGTCSSTLLAYSCPAQRYVYWFAPGPPCRSTYREIPIPSGARASHPPSTT
jgi:uncharacterized protein with NRDE domain